MKPEAGLAFCKHVPGNDKPLSLGGYPSIASPVLLRDQGVFGGLDGKLYVVPLSGKGEPWSFATAFGKPISAPAAVCDGRVYFGCEDGYLYVLGPGGKAPMPTKSLAIEKVRIAVDRAAGRCQIRLVHQLRQPGLYQCQRPGFEAAFQDCLDAPLRRHRQASAGLRRRPNVYPHRRGANLRHRATDRPALVAPLLARRPSLLHLADLPPGTLADSTSWPERIGGPLPRRSNRQADLGGAVHRVAELEPTAPPIIHDGLAIYASGSGRYAPQGSEKAYVMGGKPIPSGDGAEIMGWAYSHDNPYYPKDNKPLLWAWDLATGKEVWKKDLSKHGTGGNDCGMCLLDGKVYYSTFFGYAESIKKRRGLPVGSNGLTLALDPKTGNILWQTDKHYVTAGCTISGKDGRLYLGGYNQPREGTNQRHIWCLDAKDGSLIWESDRVASAVNVITIGEKFIFSNATRGDGHVARQGDRQDRVALQQQLQLHALHALGFSPSGRQHGHGGPVGRQPADFLRPGDRLARVPGCGRLQWPNLLHLASQRHGSVAGLRRDGGSACFTLGAEITEENSANLLGGPAGPGCWWAFGCHHSGVQLGEGFGSFISHQFLDRPAIVQEVHRPAHVIGQRRCRVDAEDMV